MEISLTEDIENIPNSLRARLSARNETDFFSSLAWYQAFAGSCIETRAKPLFLCGTGHYPNGEAFLFLPMRTPAGQPSSDLPQSLTRGETVASMTNYESVYMDPILEYSPLDHSRVLSDLQSFSRRMQKFLVADFNHCDPRTDAQDKIVTILKALGYSVRKYSFRNMLYETVDGQSYAGYLSSLSKSLRSNLNTCSNRISRAGRVECEIVSGDCQNHHIKAVFAVHAASWKNDELFPDFTRAIIEAAARCGTLRLGILKLDGEPIAVQIWIVSGGTATIYRIHYIQEYAHLSPGTVLQSKMLEHIIDVDQVKEIDFGIGDEGHKARWLTQRRTVGGVVGFDQSSISGRLRHLHYRSIVNLKQAARKGFDTLNSVAPELAHKIKARYRRHFS